MTIGKGSFFPKFHLTEALPETSMPALLEHEAKCANLQESFELG